MQAWAKAAKSKDGKEGKEGTLVPGESVSLKMFADGMVTVGALDKVGRAPVCWAGCEA